jgi:hypothetical protein
VRVRRCSPPLSRTDLAPAHAQRILRPASVTVAHERLSRVGFYGEWLTPRGARRHTAILLFGGSEGGLAGHLYLTASMLAGHGYPVLALAYFREPGLPRSLITACKPLPFSTARGRLPFGTDFGNVSQRVPAALIGIGRPGGWAFHTDGGAEQFAQDGEE